MSHRIGIVGASGYGGVELLRLLDTHPAMHAEVVAAHSQAGEPVADLFPNLPGDRTFDRIEVAALADLDLVFLATPHGPALELGRALYDAGTPVVDLSAAFRLSVEGFATWYGEPHPHPDLAAGDPAAATDVAYGLTEHARERIAGARLVANPGCYPTATLLALTPLAPLIEPGSVIVDAKSGTSGAGRAASDRLHFAHVHADLVAYGAPAHRHTGEVERWLPGELGPVSFTPHLVPMARGLLATCYATLRPDVGADQVQQALHEAYDDEAFVHVLAPGIFPHTKALAGSNGCQLSAVVDERTGRVVATAAIDNLGKGAAGQALQNANLLLGLEETTGLSAIGVYP
ncbi:MAG: N-acetyl-gamma-glutamyl-phosphate reductase [Nitriliruptoraceae bacterium]|nr:N-acetyl-gamma-glutamyl-phosphate reductase [Nitriliruptoraceae bacterium]